MDMFQVIFHALQLSFYMFWEVLWPLALGFLLSAIVQTLIPKKAVIATLGKDSPKTVVLACIFGAISSSCSYAAVSVARSLFRRGATFSNAIIFEFASTNLVFELGLVLLILLGWQFLAAEFIGGLIMIVILSVLFRLTLRNSLVKEARQQAEKGILGKMEGHGDMDMSSQGTFTAISHYFYMDIYSLYTDLLLGFLIAGVLAAWVPNSFWQAFFLTKDPNLSQIWGPIIGPIISMMSFVCSVGNIPLAAVLWNGGISFGGVISFIFADLLILPIINIYRKYYGKRMSIYLLIVSFISMALAGFLIEIIFQTMGIVPAHGQVVILESKPTLNYTTILNLISIMLIVVLGWKFLQTGGSAMLAAMETPVKNDEHNIKDLICGMMVNSRETKEKVTYKSITYYFCSSGCKETFKENPEKYII